MRAEGNNAATVYLETIRALEVSRGGGGPFFLEFLTYRWRGHVGPKWDIAKNLRSKEEVDAWLQVCPLKRFRDFLVGEALLSEEEANALEQLVREEVEEAVCFGLESLSSGDCEPPGCSSETKT